MDFFAFASQNARSEFKGTTTMTPEQPSTTDSTVRYEVTVTVTRPVRYDHDEPLSEQEAWMVSRDAKRELEREVLRALRVLDGDCDCEVMSAAIVAE